MFYDSNIEDKQERISYGLTVMGLFVRLTRGQLRWLVFVNLTRSRVTWEEGVSTKKFPTPYMACVHVCVAFS